MKVAMSLGFIVGFLVAVGWIVFGMIEADAIGKEVNKTLAMFALITCPPLTLNKSLGWNLLFSLPILNGALYGAIFAIASIVIPRKTYMPK
jgi:hypothetical protein